FLYDFNNSKKLEFLLSPNELNISNPIFTTFHITKDSTLWYCINGFGCDFKSLEVSSFKKNVTINFSESRISRILALGEKLICVFFRSNGYVILNHKFKVIDSFLPATINSAKSNIDAAITLTNGNILYTINNNLYELSAKTFKSNLINKSKPIPFNEVKEIVQIYNKMILLSSNGDLYFLNVHSDDFSLEPLDNKSIGNQKISGIKVLNENEIFISYNDIIIKRFVLKKSLELVQMNEYLINGDITSVHMLENNKTILVSTRTGIFECQNFSNNFIQIMDDDFILDQTIYAIVKDKNGTFWLSSNSGLIHYDIKSNKAILFDEKNGLKSKEFNKSSWFKKGNIIHFGSQGGLITISPNEIKASKKQCYVFLSAFRVNGSPYNNLNPNSIKSIVLEHFQNQISFQFHTMDYSPGTTKVKYKLEGLNTSWILGNKGEGQVSFPKLNPGHYTFSILGANADGVWNPEPRNIDITILPPWYATWWARSLGVLLISGIVYLTFRTYYKRQLREKDLELREKNLIISKQQALAEERTRIAAEMHDDLGGGLTTIRFLSQKVLDKSKDQSIKANISKIVNQSEILVNNMSEIIWAMNAGFDTVQSLISYTRRYANRYLENYGVELKFEVEGSTRNVKLTGVKRRNIFLTIKEALHNTVKHANANVVTIHFDVREALGIKFKDDGIGLQRENELGNGLRNMKNRIQSIEGSIEFENNQGFEIILVIPL
ncbi:MAG: triple tyrosine motif-containing protein, partial [Bacteroidota bacterium]